MRRPLTALTLLLALVQLAVPTPSAAGRMHLHHAALGGPVLYDTSIGNGVDSAGFASLPLNPGGTDGADLTSGTPNSVAGGVTYTAGTRTLSRATSGAISATWNGVLTPSTTYHLHLTYDISAALGTNFGFYVQDQSGNIYIPTTVAAPLAGEQDVLFTTSASGTNFTLLSSTNVTGSVSVVAVKANTGGLAGRRFFVSSLTGDDTRGNVAAKDPSTPWASVARALTFVQTGRGDQILVAQDTTYAATMPTFGKGGLSAMYPFVVQSYDSADPYNEAKYGRASNGHRPVLNTGGTATTFFVNPTTGLVVNHIAVRGFDFNPGNIPQAVVFVDSSDVNAVDDVLIENNIFRYTQLTVDGTGAPVLGNHVVIRNNAFYGEWGSTTGRSQGVFVALYNGVTLEDDLLDHNGWKVGASRDANPFSAGSDGGGAYTEAHPAYLQDTNNGLIYRRNLIIDGSADCGHILSDAVITENVAIDCPIALDISGGVNYQTIKPSGVLYQVSYNLFVGTADIRSTDATSPFAPTTAYERGFGIFTRNGSAGSEADHNLWIRGTNITEFNHDTLETIANFNKPSQMSYHDNVIYQWAQSGQTILEATDKDSPSPNTNPNSIVTTSYTNNIWDDPTSGTNHNIADETFSNPYTEAQLLVAAGYADKPTLVAYAIEHPETHVQRTILNLAMAGYGISHTVAP